MLREFRHRRLFAPIIVLFRPGSGCADEPELNVSITLMRSHCVQLYLLLFLEEQLHSLIVGKPRYKTLFRARKCVVGSVIK